MTELTIDGGEVNSNPHFSLHKLLLTGSPCVALVQWAIPHALLQLIILFTVIIEDIQELSENRSSIPSAATCSMEQKRNKKKQRWVPSAPRVCTRLHLGLTELILAAPWHKKSKKSQARSKQIEGCGALALHMFFSSVSENDWTWHPPKQKGTWYNMMINQWIYPTWLWLTACHGIDGP